MFRLWLKFILRFLLRIFHLFPIKNNRIIFESYGGSQLSCSPFCLYEFIKEAEKNLELVLVVKSSKQIIDSKSILFVKYGSWHYFKYVLTSKVYITNIGLGVFLPFREKQIVINTWHACCAYKKIEKDFYKYEGMYAWLYDKSLNLISQSTTYYLAAAEAAMKGMSSAWGLPLEKCIQSGLPRNDIFFHPQKMEERLIHLRNALRIEQSDFVVLYAPTFRKTVGNPFYEWTLCETDLFKAIENRFATKKIKLLLRLHLSLLRNVDIVQKLKARETVSNIMDVSLYPEMQDLLCVADMLITDYSSSVWDYSFTYRPCFLFTPDLEEYKKKTDFYTPIEEWGFSICKTNEELRKQIEAFDENKFKQAMIRHHENLGSYEKGTATEEVVKIILSHIDH